MGLLETSMGNLGQNGLVRLVGYQEFLSLDTRGRFRLPDDLAGAVHRELGRVAHHASADVPPAAFERLAFYFVPAPDRQVFLYPTTNIRLALEQFVNPPSGMDPAVIRQARGYFYGHVSFVEADRQNRLMIPAGLRAHAGIDEKVSEIYLVAQNHWLALSRSELARTKMLEGRQAFEQVAPDLLDPVYRTQPGPGKPSTGQGL